MQATVRKQFQDRSMKLLNKVMAANNADRKFVEGESVRWWIGRPKLHVRIIELFNEHR